MAYDLGGHPTAAGCPLRRGGSARSPTGNGGAWPFSGYTSMVGTAVDRHDVIRSPIGNGAEISGPPPMSLPV